MPPAGAISQRGRAGCGARGADERQAGAKERCRRKSQCQGSARWTSGPELCGMLHREADGALPALRGIARDSPRTVCDYDELRAEVAHHAPVQLTSNVDYDAASQAHVQRHGARFAMKSPWAVLLLGWPLRVRGKIPRRLATDHSYP